MGTESSSTPGAPKNISRRRVVAGAAWSVPAVMVASAAPAVAASPGELTFTGNACKLPGDSQDYFKGYVFELEANNVEGPLPRDAITVITEVTINSEVDPNFAIFYADGDPVGGCSCGPCGGAPTYQQFCTPDGLMEQRLLIYTSEDPTGSSANAEMVIKYQIYDCNDTNVCSPFGPVKTVSSGVLATPPAQGAQCDIPDALPVPPSPIPA